MPSVPDGEFWRNENRRAYSQLEDLIIEIMLKGAESGVEMLPAPVVPLMNWDTFNSAAFDYLQNYRLTAFSDLTLAQQRNVTAIIQSWIQSGDPFQSLLTQLNGYYDRPSIAETNAITEVTRIYAEGNTLSWKATGFISGKQWMTANDERVCPLCGPLHGTVVELNTGFTQTAGAIAGSEQMLGLAGGDTARAMQKAETLLRNTGASVPNPPRHFRCRCWLQPVVSVELLDQQFRDILNG